MSRGFRLGSWLVQPTLNTISRNGQSIRLEPKVVEVLVCLAEHPGEAVPKEELIRTVWGETFVTDDVLTRCISELRRALEDDAKAPRLIETIPKRGYRLLVSVEPIRVSLAWLRPTLLAGTAVLVIGLISAPYVRPRIVTRQRRCGSAKQSQLIKSLAVLPLMNRSPNRYQSQYIADGVTDELITLLAEEDLPLRLVSRTSVMQYKNYHGPLPEVARELGVDGILEASVHVSDGRVHMTVAMVYARTDTVVWGKSLDRDLSQVEALQHEVAESIAKEICEPEGTFGGAGSGLPQK